jgi:spore germination cell wall hydrolase CwlJ-like protein
MDASDLGLNGADAPAPRPIRLASTPDLPVPVATHAVAEAVPVAAPSVPSEEEDETDAPGRRSLQELVREYSSSSAGSEDAECLANAVYFESKSEPLAGQLTVAEVIINRSRSGRFPSSICGVVRQPSQFSFVRGGRLPSVPRQSAQWKTAVAIAQIALQDLAEGSAPRALFFHARRVSPGWRRLTRVATVGNHVFYR